MRHSQTARVVLVVIALTWSARAQTGDWRTVKRLPPGTRISVKAGRSPIHSIICLFERASDDTLVCERVLSGSTRRVVPPEAVYERAGVREVRLERSDASNIAVGAVLGGGVGATLGATTTRDRTARGAGALLLGIGGAALGGYLGKEFPILHGEVVYRR